MNDAHECDNCCKAEDGTPFCGISLAWLDGSDCTHCPNRVRPGFA